MRVYISTDPFSSISPEPLNKLKYNGFDYKLNSFGRKITTSELAREIGNADVLIAGTEKISGRVFEKAPNLKLISRVGIGLDGLDFELCKKYGVRVTYTPDAPTIAVAELTIGLIIDLARKVTFTNNMLKELNIWKRHMGILLNGKTIGLFGMGRIGKSVIHMLSGFNVKFLVHDINPDIAFARLYGVDLVPKLDILSYSDVVTIHIPLDRTTENYLGLRELELMQPHSILINTARGGIVNEEAIKEVLKEGKIAGAAVDVFEKEPYCGDLLGLDNCILTCHMGASTVDSRSDMELQAVEEAIRFKSGLPLKNEVFSNN